MLCDLFARRQVPDTYVTGRAVMIALTAGEVQITNYVRQDKSQGRQTKLRISDKHRADPQTTQVARPTLLHLFQQASEGVPPGLRVTLRGRRRLPFGSAFHICNPPSRTPRFLCYQTILSVSVFKFLS